MAEECLGRRTFSDCMAGAEAWVGAQLPVNISFRGQGPMMSKSDSGWLHQIRAHLRMADGLADAGTLRAFLSFWVIVSYEGSSPA